MHKTKKVFLEAPFSRAAGGVESVVLPKSARLKKEEGMNEPVIPLLNSIIYLALNQQVWQ